MFVFRIYSDGFVQQKNSLCDILFWIHSDLKVRPMSSTFQLKLSRREWSLSTVGEFVQFSNMALSLRVYAPIRIMRAIPTPKFVCVACIAYTRTCASLVNVYENAGICEEVTQTCMPACVVISSWTVVMNAARIFMWVFNSRFHFVAIENCSDQDRERWREFRKTNETPQYELVWWLCWFLEH